PGSDHADRPGLRPAVASGSGAEPEPRAAFGVGRASGARASGSGPRGALGRSGPGPASRAQLSRARVVRSHQRPGPLGSGLRPLQLRRLTYGIVLDLAFTQAAYEGGHDD